jgi:hypothetical protein
MSKNDLSTGHGLESVWAVVNETITIGYDTLAQIRLVNYSMVLNYDDHNFNV